MTRPKVDGEKLNLVHILIAFSCSSRIYTRLLIFIALNLMIICITSEVLPQIHGRNLRNVRGRLI